MPIALDVVGQLMVEMGGGSARVEARGHSIVIEWPSLKAVTSILGQWPGVRGRRLAIRRLHDGLTRAGLTLAVNVGPRTIGVLGVKARSGLASRLLGVDPMEIRVGALLGLSRRPADRPE